MAQGTSPVIPIDNANIKARKGLQLSPIVGGDGNVASPPEPDGTMPSIAMTRYQNNYRDFAFQKITPPDYGPDGCIARVTGMPANQPDFIADYHFIGLMRCMDDLLQHGYVGYIGGYWQTPKPTT